jgi:hypothetical protein
MKPTKRPAKRRGPAKMTPAHEQALALGREEARHVRNYLEALEVHKPKRGRKRTAESVGRRLADLEPRLVRATGFRKLKLAQERIALTNELKSFNSTVDLTALRTQFLKYAKGYSDRKGISYQAWRSVGVSALDLKDAGIIRGGG